MRTSEILNTAADLIETRGWTQIKGWNADDTAALCLEGGIIAAVGETFESVDLADLWACPAYRAVQSYLNMSHDLEKQYGRYISPVAPLWRWNDSRNRTATEVIEVLRACALIESAREQDAAEATYAENLAAVR